MKSKTMLVIKILIIVVIYVVGLLFFKTAIREYFLFVTPFILIYLYRRIDSLLCASYLNKKTDSEVTIKSKCLSTLTYIGDYNLIGISSVKVPKKVGEIGNAKSVFSYFNKARFDINCLSLETVTIIHPNHNKFEVDTLGMIKPVDDSVVEL